MEFEYWKQSSLRTAGTDAAAAVLQSGRLDATAVMRFGMGMHCIREGAATVVAVASVPVLLLRHGRLRWLAAPQLIGSFSLANIEFNGSATVTSRQSSSLHALKQNRWKIQLQIQGPRQARIFERKLYPARVKTVVFTQPLAGLASDGYLVLLLDIAANCKRTQSYSKK